MAVLTDDKLDLDAIEALLAHVDRIEAERANFQGQSIRPPADEICTVPPRCMARRKPTVWEMLKYRVLGPVRGFDPLDEPRCCGYQGHEQLKDQQDHEDLTGRRWAE